MSEQIYRLPEVKKIIGLSGPTVYRLISQGKFPKQIKLGIRTSGWLKSEVEQWIQQRVDASRNVRK